MNQARKITLIGTGLMGIPMSRNLMAAGYDLTVWNRTINRTTPLVNEGAKLLQQLRRLFRVHKSS